MSLAGCFYLAGLCCAALLAKYGYRVTVCESHYLPGTDLVLDVSLGPGSHSCPSVCLLAVHQAAVLEPQMTPQMMPLRIATYSYSSAWALLLQVVQRTRSR